MNRKIFITLGILMNLSMIIVPILLLSGWNIIIAYLCLLAYMLGVGFIYVYNESVPPSWWFGGATKKIYHSGFGTIYSLLSENEHKTITDLVIYEQKWFCQKQILKIDYTENIDVLISRVKKGLDNKYLLMQEKAETPFEKWDGYLDTQSKRDDKLNKLGI
jgi:hypothetical protein